MREKGYENLVLAGEDVTAIAYQPNRCQQSYRLVIVRKNLSVQRGERALFDAVRYCFHLTNRWELDLPQVVGLAHGRCDQENVIGELKHGIHARRLPVGDLLSNGAYLVMTARAWNLKAWFALLVPDRARGRELLQMEFRRFLQAIVLRPCQRSCARRGGSCGGSSVTTGG